MNAPEFAGSVVLITGASSGIGAATARRFARDGAKVVILDIAVEAGEATTAAIRADGGEATFARHDVASEADWDALAERMRAEHGRVDVLVNNAFQSEIRAAAELSPESWRRQIDVSLTGVFLSIHSLLPDLIRSKGSIILTSSVHAHFGLPGHPAYAASKGALCSLGRQLAVEYAPDVRVNIVLPGPIMTPVWDGVDEAGRAKSIAATPMGRFGLPEDVANVIAFLASADAAFVTGAELVVDGGWSVAKDSF